MSPARLALMATSALLALSTTACERERELREGKPVAVATPTADDQAAAAKAAEEAKADSAGVADPAAAEGAAPTTETSPPAKKD